MEIYTTLDDSDAGKIYALHLNTHETGVKEKDNTHIAIEYSLINGKDTDTILSYLIPMLTELILDAYGESPYPDLKPIVNPPKLTDLEKTAIKGIYK